MEQHLVTHHHLLVRMLTLADKLCNNHIHMNDMLNIFSKLKIPVSQATAEVLLHILVIDDDGLVNYIQLLRGGIRGKVQEYFQQQGSEQKDFNDANKQSFIDDISRQLQLEKHNTLSSISGENGVLASENQKEELQQFTALIDYCRNNGVILDWKLAEQGILLFMNVILPGSLQHRPFTATCTCTFQYGGETLMCLQTAKTIQCMYLGVMFCHLIVATIAEVL